MGQGNLIKHKRVTLLIPILLSLCFVRFSFAERYDYNYQTGKVDKVLDEADEIGVEDVQGHFGLSSTPGNASPPTVESVLEELAASQEIVATTYLKLDCSNDPLTSDLEVTGKVHVTNATGGALLNEAVGVINPTVVPNRGDSDTGLAQGALNNLTLACGGNASFTVNSSTAESSNANCYALVNEAVSGTNPTLCPNRNDLDTGIGRSAANTLELIGGGNTYVSLNSTTADFQGLNLITTGQASAETVRARILRTETYAFPESGPSDNQILKFNAATGNIDWEADATGAGASEWTDAGTYLHPADGDEYVACSDTGTRNSVDGDGDMYIEDELEVDGKAYFQNDVQINKELEFYATLGGNAYGQFYSKADDGLHLGIGEDDGDGNRSFVFVDDANLTNDYDHSTQLTNPTIFLHSATAAVTATDQWISLSHNQTDGVIDVGTGNIDLLDSLHLSTGTEASSSASAEVVDTKYIEYSSGSDQPVTIRDDVQIDGSLTVSGTAIPHTHLLQGSLGTADYDTDPDVWIVDLHADTFANGMTISSIVVDCNEADPTTELDADLKYCDAVGGGAFPGANAVTIAAINTATGNFSSTGLTYNVPTGKSLYITIDVDPASDTTLFHVRIHYHIPES